MNTVWFTKLEWILGSHQHIEHVCEFLSPCRAVGVPILKKKFKLMKKDIVFVIVVALPSWLQARSAANRCNQKVSNSWKIVWFHSFLGFANQLGQVKPQHAILVEPCITISRSWLVQARCRSCSGVYESFITLKCIYVSKRSAVFLLEKGDKANHRCFSWGLSPLY